MCKFCEENYEIDTMIGEKQVIIKLDEEQKDFVKIRMPFACDGGFTKPIQINYCPFCGKNLIKEHELKILSKYFEDVMAKKKNFEIIKNDRNFNVGDILYLKEWTGKEYTGREQIRIINYILNDNNYCKKGYVILGLK